MGGETKQIHFDSGLQKKGDEDHEWAGEDEPTSSLSCESSMEEDMSTNSAASYSSSYSIDLVEDASSSPASSTSSTSVSHDQVANDGPLYELSELMAQLPIKRGLSKFYKGKSQSFTSLARVKSIEDLAKKVNPYNSRYKMKSCKSFAALDTNRSFGPKLTICKKTSSRGSFLSSLSQKSSLLTDG